jgi:hypothetical protein
MYDGEYAIKIMDDISQYCNVLIGSLFTMEVYYTQQSIHYS